MNLLDQFKTKGEKAILIELLDKSKANGLIEFIYVKHINDHRILVRRNDCTNSYMHIDSSDLYNKLTKRFGKHVGIIKYADNDNSGQVKIDENLN